MPLKGTLINIIKFCVMTRFFRSSNHLPAWFLCLPGGEEMVGAILQAALARHCCYLSQGPGGWGPWREEVGGEDGQKDGHPLLPSGIHPLHPPAVS